MTGRLRRARCLVGYWSAQPPGRFIAHPYPHSGPVELAPADVAVLHLFNHWSDPDQVVDQALTALPDHDPDRVRKTIDTLHTDGRLLAENSEQALRDEQLAEHWAPWHPQAPFLHYTTQDFTLEAPAQPPEPMRGLFTTYPDAERILLPRQPADLSRPYGQVLYQRRTHDTFNPDPVPLTTLAVLLAAVFGPVDYVDAGPAGALYRRTTPCAGALYRRTTPCAGARQELEAYLAIRNGTHTTPGWYHYNAAEHSLELLADGATSDELTDLCMGQEHAGQAAFLVALVAVIERQTSRHHTPRSYRACLLDAGHLGQTFTLTVTALGLGPLPIGRLQRHHPDPAPRPRPITHIPLHLLGAGHPTNQPNPYAHTAGLDAFRATTQHTHTTLHTDREPPTAAHKKDKQEEE